MNNLRIVFMGTPEFAVPALQALHEAGNEIIAVITQPDRPKGRGQKLALSPVKEKALELGLQVLQPPKVKEASFIAELQKLQPDLIIVVAFGQILPKDILTLPALGCINVHGSLLPAYRGAAPIQRAILNGEKSTGITTMLMDVGLDTGDMLLKEAVEIHAEMTFGQLHDELAVVGARVLVDAVRLRKAHQLTPQPQDNALATYAAMLKREDELIHWEDGVEKIHNQVRGLEPWPGAYTLYGGQGLKIRGSIIQNPDAIEAIPGSIIKFIKGQGFVVQCGRGSLLVTTVQPFGKKVMSADSFANGYRLEVGHVFRVN